MKRWFKVLTSSLAVVLFITFSCAAFAAAPVKLRTAWLDEHEAFLVWYAKEKGWDKSHPFFNDSSSIDRSADRQSRHRQLQLQSAAAAFHERHQWQKRLADWLPSDHWS